MKNLLEGVKELVNTYKNLGDYSVTEKTVLKNKKTGEIIANLEEALLMKVNLSDYEVVKVILDPTAKLLEVVTGGEPLSYNNILEFRKVLNYLPFLAGEKEFERIKRNLMQNRSKARKNDDKAKQLLIDEDISTLYSTFGKVYTPKS